MSYNFPPTRTQSASPVPPRGFGDASNDPATAHRTIQAEFATPVRSTMHTPDLPEFFFPTPPSPTIASHNGHTILNNFVLGAGTMNGSGTRSIPTGVSNMSTTATVAQMTSRKDALKTWTDRVAGQLKLTNVQLAELHFLVELGKNVDPPQLQGQLWQIAHQYRMSNVLEAIQSKIEELTVVINDLKTVSNTTFKLNDDQVSYLRRQAKDMAFNPNRTTWLTMNDELEHMARNVEGFRSIFGNDWREKVLRGECKDISGSARSQLRSAIFKSMAGRTKTNLEQATYRMAQKFRRGGAGGSLDVDYQVHVALLRRFTNEKMGHLLAIEEGDGDDLAPLAEKRKGTGKVPKGEDYWSLAEIWFAEKIAHWGTEIKTKAWQDYIQETLRLDIQQFKRGPGTLMDPIPMLIVEPSSDITMEMRSIAGVSGGLHETPASMNALAVIIE